MSEKTHKHKGVERSNGTLRVHPISRKHKDKTAQKYHNIEVGNKVVNSVKTVFEKMTKKTDVIVKIDKEGYLTINLDSVNCKGLKVTFTRDENGEKKLVGIKIDNKPSKDNKQVNFVVLQNSY